MNWPLKRGASVVAIGLLCGGLLLPVRAQTADFPRTVIDPSGAPVIIPTRPARIGLAGGDPVAAWALPASDWRMVEPENGQAVDLLIVPELVAITHPALVAAAAAADVPVFRTTPITSLAQWRETARLIGMAAGREADVADRILQLDRRQKIIHDRVGDARPVRVLVLTPEGYTFGQNTWITDLIGAAGGINVAAEAGFADYRQITDSTLRELAPDVILLSPAFVQIAAYADLPSARVIRLPFSPTIARDPGAELTVLALMLHPGLCVGPVERRIN